MTIFIGDVHGKYKQYHKIIKENPNTIQIGDLGVGFVRRDGSYYPNPHYDLMVETNSRFIRGNHDNPNVCKKHTQWIPDGHYENNMFFLGGANSIDKQWRTKNLDWWENEELSYKELDKIADKYVKIKPKIMVTHEAPEYIVPYLVDPLNKINENSRTRNVLNSMFFFHQPTAWIFGHWHQSLNFNFRGTNFICLNELETIKI